MTSARKLIAGWEITLKLECNDCGQKAFHETPLGHHTADAILDALDAAGFAVVQKEPTEAIRFAVIKHVPETELSADDLYRAFIKAAGDAT